MIPNESHPFNQFFAGRTRPTFFSSVQITSLDIPMLEKLSGSAGQHLFLSCSSNTSFPHLRNTVWVFIALPMDEHGAPIALSAPSLLLGQNPELNLSPISQSPELFLMHIVRYALGRFLNSIPSLWTMIHLVIGGAMTTDDYITPSSPLSRNFATRKDGGFATASGDICQLLMGLHLHFFHPLRISFSS